MLPLEYEAALDQFPPCLLHPFVAKQTWRAARLAGAIAKWQH
jgi:hypothetical protein